MRFFCLQFSSLFLFAVPLSTSVVCLLSEDALAAITNTGAITNPPNTTTGAYSGTMTVGNGAFGSVAATLGSSITGSGGVVLGNGDAGIGQISLNGFGTDWLISGGGADVTLGDEGTGLFSLSNSARAVVPDDTLIGIQSTGNGKLTVDGLGTFYESGDDFTVGVSGIGFVEITAGGAVESDLLLLGNNATAQGTVKVSDELSQWRAGALTVAATGVGRLEILNGGRLSTTGTVVAGILAGSSGTIEVTGNGSLWSSTGSNFTVGNVGTGRLRVLEGGRVTTSSSISLGSGSDSVAEIVVDGVGSRLSVGGALNSESGDVSILISNGGVVSTTSPSTVSPTTRLTLDGGRWESSQTISLGGVLQGTGTIDAPVLNILTNIGSLRTAEGDHLLVTGLASNNRQIDLAGGELEIRGFLNNDADIDARNGAVLRVGGTGLDNNSGSQLAITGGVVDVFGAVDNNAGAEIAVVGGATAVFHDAVTNNGTIFVSASSEIVMLENLAFEPSSSLSLQLATMEGYDDPTDAFGLVGISGTSALAGTLQVSFDSGFTPSAGDTFEVLRASGGLTGTFATETLPLLGGGLALDVQYTPNSVVLAVVSNLAGDFDQDGDVDGADFLFWQRNPAIGNLADWQANFGAPLEVASHAVPEPSSGLLILLSIQAVFFQRPKKL